MNVQGLTKQETNLLHKVRKTSGSMIEKAQKLKDAGVFASYKKVHQDYASLASCGDIEALKRAAFIQWYSATEPSCFTGIPGDTVWSAHIRLDEEVERNVLKLVQQSILSNQIDEEFKDMLTHYFLITDYYFEHYWGNMSVMPRLRKYLQESNYPEYLKRLSNSDFSNRGQMGDFWLRLVKKDD